MRHFLGLGAQRSGTTWLFECLRSHPEIHLPDEKELQYFSDLEEINNAEKSLSWYLEKLQITGSQKISGEITPEYLLDPRAPQRIKEALNQPRLIVCLREPVSRAVSAYKKGLRENKWDCSLEQFLAENKDHCLDRGLYAVQLERYLDLYPHQDICIKIYEDIALDPASFMRDIYQFLGVDPAFESPMLDFKFNIGAAGQPDRIRVVVFFRDLVYTLLGPVGRKWIVKAMQRTPIGNRWMQSLLKPEDSSQKTPNPLLSTYRDLFRDDVRKTSSLVGRDLISLWGYDG